MAQRPMAGWKYEIRIGVDGCAGTAAILQRNHIKFWASPVNVGTYVMANSLIALGPADVYARFDADDYMLPTYLQTVIPLALQYGMAQAGYRVGRLYSKPRVGQVSMTSETLDKLGGFAEYRCHCDRDLSRRAALIGIDIRGMRHDKRLALPLFIKGVNRDSLTHNFKVGCGSKYRKKVRAILTERRAAGQLKIIPQTTELKQ